MVDLNRLSADLRGRIKTIMNGDGQDVQKIDSRNEYNQLAQLLSGGDKVTGDDKNFVEGMLADYEEEHMVRQSVKDRVLDIIKFGDSKKADDKAELSQLKDYKKTDGLSKEEKNWIQRVINGRVVKTDAPENNEVVEPKQVDVARTTTGENSPRAEQQSMPEENNDFPHNPPAKPQPEPKPETPAPSKVEVKNTYAPTYAPTNQHDNSVKQGGNGEGQINISNNSGTINIYPDGTEVAQNEEVPESPKTGLKLTELDAIANQIFDAINGAGTKEAQLDSALKSITKENILELLTTYNAQHPDMFEAILDDLSGNKYDEAVNILMNALVDRAKGTDVESNVAEQKGVITSELDEIILLRRDETIVTALNEMARLIRQEETK